MIDNKILGLKIKELRSKKGRDLGYKYTGDMLANDLNISRSYLGDIESGRRTPPFELLSKIADVFDVSVSYFDNEDSESNINKDISKDSKTENPVDSDIVRIERARNKMPQEDKENMMKVLEAAFGKYFKD